MQMQSAQQGPPSLEQSIESGQGADVERMADGIGELPDVSRQDDADWGRLRDQSAEDVTEGSREGVSAEYRRRVETYFRIIAERARQRAE
jgi:hypothetical protein